MSRKILTYDCEIVGDPNKLGWTNYGELGISVIGIHADWLDYPLVIGIHADWLDCPLVSLDCRFANYLDTFQVLVSEADWIVGFNSIGFDDPLCRAHGVDIVTDIDVLHEIRALSGQPRYYTAGVTRGGYNLNAVAIANGLSGKTGSGALAPLLWAQGKQKSYTLANGDKWRVILRPAVAKNAGKVSEIIVQMVTIWLDEKKSTGDVIARDDFWLLAGEILSLLQIQNSDGSPSQAEILELFQSDPWLTEQVFITQDFDLQPVRIGRDENGSVAFSRDLDRWEPSVIIALHRFDPKKKLLEAYLLLSPPKENQTEQ